MTITARVIGALLVAMAAGCAGTFKEAPAVKSTTTGTFSVDPSLAPPEKAVAVAEAKEQIKPEAARQEKAPQDELPADKPLAKKSPVERAKTPVHATAPAPAKSPAKVAVPAAAPELTHKAEEPTAVAKKAEPTLDVAALKARLRSTEALGVLAKLALQNQMDDL